MTPLLLSEQELGGLLHRRTISSGLRLFEKTLGSYLSLPKLPEGVNIDLNCGGGANGHHRCEDHRVVRIPAVLVVDLVVPEVLQYNPLNRDAPLWQAGERFKPYWLMDVLLVHDRESFPDYHTHRILNIVEAACVLAQHPYLGSVQSQTRSGDKWRSMPMMQVYQERERGHMVASKQVAYCHHLAFAGCSIGCDSPVLLDTPVTAEKPPTPTAETVLAAETALAVEAPVAVSSS